MTREELAAALRKADAAGNADDARRLAGAIRQLDAGSSVKPTVRAPARPAMDPLHMVKPAARAQVAANQPRRNLPMSPLGPGNERYAPRRPPGQGDPLAPANPQAAAANVDAQQRARGLVPYTHAPTGETYWRPDPAKQVADANAQFRAREAAKATGDQAQAEYDGFRNSRPDWMNQTSDAIRGGFAATENAAFGAVNAGLDAVDPRRKASQFITQNVTPAAEQLGRSVGGFIEGPSGRFGGMAGPAAGAIMGGVSELGATMARDPQDASTQIVTALEPTSQLARGVNTTGDAFDAAMGGNFGRSGNLMAQAVPDLIGGTGVLPAMSITANAMRTAVRAPQRALAEQIARIQPLPASGRVPTSAPRAVPPMAAAGAGGPPPAAPAAPGPPVPSRSRAEQRADDIFIKKMEADGVTVEDLSKIQARLARRGDSGVYETSGEIAAMTDKSSGANLRGLQMAGGAAPGPLQEALVGIVNQNTDKLSSRLSRGATRATGQKADNAVATLNELETRLRTEAAPAYDAAYATPVDPKVFANELVPVLNTPSGQKALQSARNNLASVAADLQARAARGASERAMMESQRAQAAVKSIDDYMADPVRGTAIPTTMALDYTKRAFDDVIANAGFGSDTARIVGGTKRNFADSVSQATGGNYGNALGVFEDVKRLEDAFEVGTDALNKKTWQLERDIAKGRSGSPWTAGEVEALAMGVARNIEDLIEANNQSALTKLLKDKALKNVATALGSQKAADMFEETIRRLGANREWGRRVAGGSDTAMRQAAIRDAGMEGEDAVTRTLDRIETSGNQFSLPGLVNDVAVKPIARTAKDIYQRLRYPGVYDEEVNRALIPLIGKPMTEANLNEVIRRVEARLVEKGKIPPAQPAAAAGPPTRRTRGPGGNPPGSTSPASATGTGIVAGGVLGAMAPADDENQQLINALFGAGVGGGIAGGAAKFAQGSMPKGPPRMLSRVAAGGAAGGIAGGVAGEAVGQEDLTGKITETEQTIADLKKAMADLDKITDPFEKQRFLKAQGYYAGKIDGSIMGKTTEGIERWKGKKEADLKKAESERKDLVRRDALQSNRPDPLMMALREYGPAVLGIGALFGMKYMRGGAAKASVKTAEAESKKLNRLITKGPVTGALNKRDENRFSNLNKLWQKGGASKEELPFKQDSVGNYKPNGKAKLPEELFADSGVWQTVTKYVKGKDVAIILGGGLDVAIAQPFIEKANENLTKAEAAWNDTPSDETAKALEDAKNEVAAYTLLQRIGMGVAAGRVLGKFGGAYAKPMPNIPAAASEQAKLKQFIAGRRPPPQPRTPRGPPPAPPPAPPAAPPAPPSAQLPLPLIGGGKKKP